MCLFMYASVCICVCEWVCCFFSLFFFWVVDVDFLCSFSLGTQIYQHFMRLCITTEIIWMPKYSMCYFTFYFLQKFIHFLVISFPKQEENTRFYHNFFMYIHAYAHTHTLLCYFRTIREPNIRIIHKILVLLRLLLVLLLLMMMLLHSNFIFL